MVAVTLVGFPTRSALLCEFDHNAVEKWSIPPASAAVNSLCTHETLSIKIVDCVFSILEWVGVKDLQKKRNKKKVAYLRAFKFNKTKT